MKNISAIHISTILKVFSILALLLGLVTNVNAAINYLVLNGTAGWTANAGSSSAIMSAKIASTCPNNYVGYYGLGTINTNSIQASQSGGVYSGFPFTGNSIICIAGVPSSITLTPAGSSASNIITLNLGDAYQALTPIGSSPRSVGIVLPDRSMVVSFAFSYYYQPSATSYYGSALNRMFSQLSVVPVANSIPSGAPFTISGTGSVCYAPTQEMFGAINSVNANICSNYVAGY